MAEVSSEATLSVDVQGESGLQRLANALQKIKRDSGTAGTRPQAVSPTQSARQSQSLAVSIAERVGSAIGATLRAPFDALKASGQVLGRSMLSLSGTFGRLAGGTSVVSTGIVSVGAAIIGLVAPLINLVGGFHVLRTAFEWAQTAAEQQIKVAGRARRFMPQAIGAGVEAAEEEMRGRMVTATALFGNAADSMQEQLTRRMSDYRLGKGLRGEKDIFARWGITPEGIERYEKLTGSRVDLTTWLRLFVLKREDLERRLGEAKTPAERNLIIRKLKALSDDTTKIFGQNFSDMMSAMTDRDLAKLQGNLKAALPLGHVENYTRKAVDFFIALESLKATFSAITLGVGGDVQPAITSFLNELNRKLLDVKEGGQGLGRSFRELASAMAEKTWQTLRDIMADLTPKKVNDWIAIVKSWQPKETAETVKNLIGGVVAFGRAIGRIVTLLEGLFGRGETEAAPGAAPAAGAPAAASGAPAQPPPVAAPGPPAPVPSGAASGAVSGAPASGAAPAAGAGPAAAPIPSVPSAVPPTAPSVPSQQSNLEAVKAAAAGRAAVSASVQRGPGGDTLVLRSTAQAATGAAPGASGLGATGGAQAPFGAQASPGRATGLPVPYGLPPGLGMPGEPGAPGYQPGGLFAPAPELAGFGFSALTSQDGAAFGAAAAQSLKDGLDGASVGGPAPTSYGVAPRAAPKPTGGDTASES